MVCGPCGQVFETAELKKKHDVKAHNRCSVCYRFFVSTAELQQVSTLTFMLLPTFANWFHSTVGPIKSSPVSSSPLLSNPLLSNHLLYIHYR
jgi:hypothetical protein